MKKILLILSVMVLAASFSFAQRYRNLSENLNIFLEQITGVNCDSGGDLRCAYAVYNNSYPKGYNMEAAIEEMRNFQSTYDSVPVNTAPSQIATAMTDIYMYNVAYPTISDICDYRLFLGYKKIKEIISVNQDKFNDFINTYETAYKQQQQYLEKKYESMSHEEKVQYGLDKLMSVQMIYPSKNNNASFCYMLIVPTNRDSDNPYKERRPIVYSADRDLNNPYKSHRPIVYPDTIKQIEKFNNHLKDK